VSWSLAAGAPWNSFITTNQAANLGEECAQESRPPLLKTRSPDAGGLHIELSPFKSSNEAAAVLELSP
jgi:hypothetical protein